MTRRLAALATALAGVVTLVSSLSANEPGRQLYLEAFEPGSAQAAAHALGAIGGLLTLWLAAGVLRGRRSAGRAAVVVLCVLAAVHIAKGLDYEEALIALVVAVVLHRALQQVGQPDRRPSRRLVATLGLLVGVASAYASSLTILLISGHSAGIGSTLWTAARSIVIGVPAAVGGEPRSLMHLAGALVVAAIVVVLRALQVGLEAVVAPCEFDLDAPGLKTVRKAVRRVARRGWTIELVRGAGLTPPLISDLTAVETAWRRRGHRRLYGFAMASDRLWGAPEDCRDLYA